MLKTHLLLAVTVSSLVISVGSAEPRFDHALKAAAPEVNQTADTDIQGCPLYHEGMITIKVKKGVGPLFPLEGMVNFAISSLDERASRFEVNSLGKRFKHRPIPRGSGLPDLSRIYRITFPSSYDVKMVANSFSRDPNIEYAEPIPISYLCEASPQQAGRLASGGAKPRRSFLAKTGEVPNDSLYSEMQHLHQIMAEEAWSIHHGEDGAEEVIIGVVDSSVEWSHPDLIDNIWQNLGEDTDGDGRVLEFIDEEWVFDPDDENAIDDDGNGYIDDFIGWDFINEYGEADNNPAPEGSDSHGTHCAGIAAGATDNEIGIASISWNLKIMPSKIFYNIDEEFFLCCPYAGIIYCAENGADVISNSWGHYAHSQADEEAIAYAIGLGSIIVGAAANDNITEVFYPAGYPGCISVASVAVTDVKAGYSNYGIPVDVCAPGGDYAVDGGILSTVVGGYSQRCGTSMATPMVAGLLGLIESYQPTWSNEQIIARLIGTADDIDALNPGYENMLGSGRINAFWALNKTGVTVPQELRLALFDVLIADENADQAIEQGERVTLEPVLRNYAHDVTTDNAQFTLTTTDPDIMILDGVHTDALAGDGYTTLDDAFEIQITADASSHVATMAMHIDADIDITFGEDMEFELFIEPSGVLVWEGFENGSNYSGSYMSGFFTELGLNCTYSTTFPSGLDGFDAVFLSFGNRSYYGLNTTFSGDMAEATQRYLENGGRVFLEGGDALGSDQAENDTLLALFGLSDTDDGVPGETPITNLVGQSSTIAEGFLFTGSTQPDNLFIDRYTPDQSGAVAFAESAHGNVAVQNEGEFGQKTFCFSYALGELIDRDALSNRYNLLKEICTFFEVELPSGYLVANFLADQTQGGAPFEVEFTDISVCDPEIPIVSWEWDLDGNGTVDSEEQNPVWTYEETGTFSVRLVVSNGVVTDTLSVENLIRVGVFVSGTWAVDDSPYYIDSDITVPDGETLIIDPGVEVIFTGHHQFIVEGSLLAVGTPEDSILFTAQNPDTGWKGIQVYGDPGGQDSTKIMYAIIEYGRANGGSGYYSNCGGGIGISYCDEVLISHCRLRYNTASGVSPEYNLAMGGAISVGWCSPTVSHNVIANNTAEAWGGAIGLTESSPRIERNVIAHNSAGQCGGAIGAAIECNPILINNTIAYNSAGSLGGGGLGLYYYCSPTLMNTILWQNTADDGDEIGLLDVTCDPNFYYCDVAGEAGGFGGPGAGSEFDGAYENCIDADPLFIDAENGDFRLSTKSPCIDTGHPDSQYNDPDGSRNDMGALPFDSTAVATDTPVCQQIFRLAQNYPNPFRPGGRGTWIEYSIPTGVECGRIDIINVAGQVVRSFRITPSEESIVGSLRWNGTGEDGLRVSSGLYFYRLRAASQNMTRKMVVLQ